MNRSTIGGYLGLTSKNRESKIHKNSIKLQSARACLYLFLSSTRCKKLYIPNLRCDVIDHVVLSLGINFECYEVGPKLELPEKITLKDDEFVLITNYFGICSDDVQRFLSNHDKDKVILDNAQAYYSKVTECACAIYSVRKFIGAPDGGVIYTNISIKTPDETYAPKYIDHLLLDFSDQQSHGYNSYLNSEGQLSEEFKPKNISSLSKKLMTLYDDELNIKARQNNYNILDDAFGTINKLKRKLKDDDIPLCYPLYLSRNVEKICSILASRGIFLPRYWPSKKDNCEVYNKFLFLPVDQRIDSDQLKFLIDEVGELIE
ncbi:hypothetical protein JCM19233_3372 [Vibrio astriarenae]|nr:hypothetical protein JCM19233_3372 [Vibrio sp. C7]